MRSLSVLGLKDGIAVGTVGLDVGPDGLGVDGLKVGLDGLKDGAAEVPMQNSNGTLPLFEFVPRDVHESPAVEPVHEHVRTPSVANSA